MLIDQVQLLLLSAAKALVASVVILAVALAAFRVLRSTLRRLTDRMQQLEENRSHERQVRLQTLSGVGQATGAALLGCIAGLMVLGQFVNISPLLAGAGVIGLAIGLGSKSLIRDVIAGFFILLEDHFGVGDRITVNDRYKGQVEHLDLRRTVLRNVQNGSVLTIPNGEIRVVANTTKEWSQEVVDVHVDYSEDVDRALEVLESAAAELRADPDSGPLLLEQPEVLGVEDLGESDMTLRVILKTRPGRQAPLGRRYRAMVKRGFEREGVAAPSSQPVILACPQPVTHRRSTLHAREVNA
jgi:moderate conductance mechanosensitive channel